MRVLAPKALFSIGYGIEGWRAPGETGRELQSWLPSSTPRGYADILERRSWRMAKKAQREGCYKGRAPTVRRQPATTGRARGFVDICIRHTFHRMTN